MQLEHHAQYTAAALLRRNINAEVKQIEDLRLSITRPIDEAKKNVMEMFRPSVDVRKKCVILLDTKLTKYVADQQAAVEKQREAAQQALSKEKAKQETLASKALERAQQQRSEAQQKRDTASEATNSDDKARLLREAEHLETLALQNEQRAGERAESAESIDPEAVNVAEANLAVDGVRLGHYWKGRITNLPAVLRQIADGKLDLTVEIPQSELDRLASSLKKAVKIEGLEFYQDARVASSRS